jgi:hypothetical protein
MLSQDYVKDHRDEARESYLNIFNSLADEFRDRSFVLIFDQFEYVGKASIDFFLNFTKFLMIEERFHIIVSFRTESSGRDYGDVTARRLYEDTRDKLIVDLGGEELRLKGLSAEDIGKWIKLSRGIQLPLVPDLRRIRKNSGGLPLLLNEWIRNPRNVDYDQIQRDKLCDTIRRQETGLSDSELVKLYKLSSNETSTT